MKALLAAAAVAALLLIGAAAFAALREAGGAPGGGAPGAAPPPPYPAASNVWAVAPTDVVGCPAGFTSLIPGDRWGTCWLAPSDAPAACDASPQCTGYIISASGANGSGSGAPWAYLTNLQQPGSGPDSGVFYAKPPP